MRAIITDRDDDGDWTVVIDGYPHVLLAEEFTALGIIPIDGMSVSVRQSDLGLCYLEGP